MPRWKELKRYLDKNGWELYKTTNHYYYRKPSNDNAFMYSKVSMGSGEIPKKLWKFILNHELHITQEDFNKGLK